MPEPGAVVDALRQHLRAHFAITSPDVTETTRLDDLGFSSLEVVEVLVSFREEVLGREDDDDDAELPAEPVPLETLGDLAAMMLSQRWLDDDDIARLRTASGQGT